MEELAAECRRNAYNLITKIVAITVTMIVLDSLNSIPSLEVLYKEGKKG